MSSPCRKARAATTYTRRSYCKEFGGQFHTQKARKSAAAAARSSTGRRVILVGESRPSEAARTGLMVMVSTLAARPGPAHRQDEPDAESEPAEQPRHGVP